MENAKMLEINVNLILLDAGWSDLGSFDALYELEEKDGDNNIFKGDVVSLDARNTIAISTKKNISLLGVNDLIVIETSDSVLVANKDNLQSIKKLVKILEKNHQYLLKEHTRVNRPWGWFETLEEGDTFKVKCIHIYSGKSISLQKHQHRAEHWVVVKGDAVITKGNKKFNLSANQSTYIEKNQIHQITNKSDQTLMIIEVQSGEYLGEDDIERLEDKYGR
jgi:mannose-1-phosphate guanylyltransferase/mannose-6-phosphate isomerase